MKKFSKATSLAFLSFLALASSASASSPRTFTVGIEDGYYPYEYLDEKGNFTGYDVEVLNAVCAKLGADCKLARGSFEALIPNLIYKKTDFVISALSITAEREKKVAFSVSYVPPQAAIYLAKGSKNLDVKSLKTVGVQQGTTLAHYLEEKNQTSDHKVEIRYYNSFDQEILDLNGNRIDAAFESLDVSKKFLNDKSQDLAMIGEKVYSPLISRGTGIAFRKQDKELLAEVNKALEELKADGTLERLQKKYGIDD